VHAAVLEVSSRQLELRRGDSVDRAESWSNEWTKLKLTVEAEDT